MLVRSMSDAAIVKAIGQRLQELRLLRNISLQELSGETGISRQTLHSLLHKGKGTLASTIAVMRALSDLESLGLLLEPPPVSPIMLLQLQRDRRKRATGTRKKPAISQSKQIRPAKDLDW